MKKSYIILTGIGCFFPIVVILLTYAIQMPTSFILIDAYISASKNILDLYNSLQPSNYPTSNDFWTLRILFVTIRFVLLIVFIRHLFNDTRMENSSRLAWLAMLIIFSPIALPVYWAVKVLRGRNGREIPTDPATNLPV